MNNIIKITNLTKHYKKKVLFENSSFSIESSGTITKITGAKGSGKSTLVGIIAGLDTSYEGQYYLFNQNTKEFDQSDWNLTHENRLRVVSADYNLRDNFSVFNNLKYSYFHFDEEQVIEVLKLFDLYEIKDKKVKKITRFEQAKLAVARGYLSNAKLLIFDEPLSLLNEEEALAIFDYFKMLRTREYTIIYTSTNNNLIDQVDNHYHIIDNQIVLNEQNIISNDYILESTKLDYSKNKNRNTSYIIKNYLINTKYLFIQNIFMALLIAIIVLAFGTMFNQVTKNINQDFLGLKDNYILMSTQEYDEALDQFVFQNPDKLYFNEEDIQKVKNSKYVDDVIAFNYGMSSHTDYEDNVLDLASSKKLSQFENYSFSSYPLPKAADGLLSPTVDYFDVDVMYGEIPDDMSNEILIPIDMATTLNNDVESLIGTPLTLSVIDENDNKLDKEYLISGIYQTTFSSSKPETIYTSYIDRHGKLSEPLYEYIINGIDANMFPDESMVSYEHMQKAWGDGYSHLLVYIPNQTFLHKAVDTITEKFPNIYIKASYQKYEGEYLTYYNTKLLEYALIMFALALFMGMISILIFSNYRTIKSYEFMVNYLNGYTYINNQMSLLFDFIVNSIIIYILALLFIYLGSYLDVFTDYFNFGLQLFNHKYFLFSMFMFTLLINIPLTLTILSKNKRSVFKYLFN